MDTESRAESSTVPDALSEGSEGGSTRTMHFLEAVKGDREERGLGTFPGVFRPTVLTILGVMMYLRLGWVVGEAGLVGAVLIIATCYLITLSTALSLSSITTNIRLGAGGVFAIISQSLGLETGGAIGIPLYLAQALSAALYVYGFSEGWLYIFPDHPQWAVTLGMFACVFSIAMISTRLAFKLQGIVMIFIMASVTAIILGAFGVGEASGNEVHGATLWNFSNSGFWEIFAVFFPAATGIMVGASMSGDLKQPRRSIPVGTLSAVIVSGIVYLVLAGWYSVVATPDDLVDNFLISVDRSAFKPLVLGGILASTFTAALSSVVAAPRVLQALGQHRILPRAEFFSKLSRSGEPRNAMIVTAVIIVAALSLGSLDRVAVLITMFFMLTYVTINIVVLIEQSLGMVSFRPVFRVPIWVPLIGSVSCVMAIFVISPTFALVALSIVVAIYIVLLNRELETPWETVRSSIFVSLSNWAAKRVAAQPESETERSWKPDLLVPVLNRAQLDGNYRFLRALVQPKGSIQIVGVRTSDTPDQGFSSPKDRRGPGETARVDTSATRELASIASADAQSSTESSDPPATPTIADPRITTDLDAIDGVAHDFQLEGLYTSSVVIAAQDLVTGVAQSSAVMRGAYFRPNVLFGLAHSTTEDTMQGLYDIAVRDDMGASFLFLHPEAGLGRERSINVWVRDQSPEWELGLRLANLDLAVLFAYQIWTNWRGTIRLVTACRETTSLSMAKRYLEQLAEDARLPQNTECVVLDGEFSEALVKSPKADIQILGLSDRIDKEFMNSVVMQTHSSALFVRDSGRESALA